MSSRNRVSDLADRSRDLLEKSLAVQLPLTIKRAEYPHDYATPRHRHHSTRFLHAVDGVVIVSTLQGIWVVPPGHGLLIPSGAEHDVRMVGDVVLQILDIERNAAIGLGEKCFVVDLSPLLHHLFAAASTRAQSTSSAREQAIASLFLYELQSRPFLPLSLPLPSGETLSERCSAFFRRPNSKDSIELWSSSLNMSRRTFTRRFKGETGLSFAAWRQRACLIAAIPRLARGDAICTVASSLGFDRPASFTAMFKRWLGTTPIAYRRTGS